MCGWSCGGDTPMQSNSRTPILISGTPRSFLNFGKLPGSDSDRCDRRESLKSAAPPGRGRVGLGEHDVLVVARTAPASEDGVQLGRVKRPSVLTVRIAREPAETSGAVEEPRRR